MRSSLNTPIPPTGAAAVTPSDATVFDPSEIYVGGAGNVAVQPADPTLAVVVFTAPPVGSVLPLLVTKVMATNTTATLMVRLF